MARTLRLPLQVGASGAMQTLEHGSPGEVAQSVALLLATRPGERRSVPGYGLADQLGAGVNPTALLAVVAEWEPRAAPADVEALTAGREQYVVVHPAQPADTEES